jgi:integrase/recombinase XerD
VKLSLKACKPKPYQGIYSMVKDWAKAAGLENVHPHSGRHTFASRLLENGMDAFLAMKLTRHRSIQAFKTYTHELQYQAAKADYWRGRKSDRLCRWKNC